MLCYPVNFSSGALLGEIWSRFWRRHHLFKPYTFGFLGCWYLYSFGGGEMGTMMWLPLKIKSAVVQLVSDWQNGNTFASDRFHFQAFSSRVSLLVMSWLLHESSGGRGTITPLHLPNQQRGYWKRRKPSSGREHGTPNQLGNLRKLGFLFFLLQFTCREYMGMLINSLFRNIYIFTAGVLMASFSLLLQCNTCCLYL